MIGIGGFGKCRILKQAVEAFEIANKSIVVRHLSRNAEVSATTQEAAHPLQSIRMLEISRKGCAAHAARERAFCRALAAPVVGIETMQEA
ncbi:hypothetical protein I6F21_08555 [Bradyrhizobium sp. NBAIM03]|uniref:hypothetical protein n=1 Tax=Bradyrhizobium sp. NBAIM03 TaxID=2793816 RepID=UPI001CD5AE37|nr:hypothetical protein [Bradyrhizobium sp. NBAIM03]MCA1532606.1 hypothetical protein [Bradyrhizobium sp. NBAIM03]